jgi:hypothetical protein
MRVSLLPFLIGWCVILVHAAHAEIGDWVNASQMFLQQIYTAHDYCVLTNPDPMTNCKRKASSNAVENECSSLTKKDRIRQLSFPQSMYHIPKEFADNEESSLPLTKLTDMFISLNRTNRVLMLIGDSITRNSIESLECLLSIEQRTSDKITISPPVFKVLWGATKYTISLSNSKTLHQIVTVNVLYFAVWTQYGNGAGDMYLNEALRLLKHHDPTTGIVFVFNIGMHEKHEPTQTKHVTDMIQFAKKKILPMTNRNNLFLYREASAQHYNSTAGYFNFRHSLAWKTKKKPLPTCVPYSEVENDTNDWRYKGEQGAFKSTHFDNKNVIPFRKISRHYFDVHSSSPFFKSTKHKAGPDRDCTHFNPLAAPVLYRILWYQILHRALH